MGAPADLVVAVDVGAPFDALLLPQLAEADLSQYKVLIFLNTTAMSNTQAALDGIRVSATDVRTTELALADFRVNRGDLWSLFGNDIGGAFGVEWRREEYFDDRDARLDGSMPYTNGPIFDESDLPIRDIHEQADGGLIIHTTAGIGYETPWRQVAAMLKLAADRTRPRMTISNAETDAADAQTEATCATRTKKR